jgi:AcrR family transcriptional regulator
MARRKRDHLVDTALGLFMRDGYHATGIDRILAEAGVAKMTLYNNFRSKEALIVAALERHDAAFTAWFEARVEALGETPAERLLALFDALDEWVGGDDFHGCPFMKACGEFDDVEDPVHAAALAHKRRIFVYIRGLAEAAGADDPARLAGELFLLLEGAMIVAQMTRDRSTARRARAAAETLVAATLTTS